MRGAALALVLLMALAGCRSLGGPRIADCPGPLRATQGIEGDFLLRMRVRMRAGDADLALQIAARKRGSELVLVGFDPLGVELFSVVQRGLEVQVDSLPAPALPVAPRNLLRDLHRIRFLGLEPPPGGSGRAEGIFDGTRVSEEWSGGRLRIRRFEQAEDPRAGAVLVTFEAAEARLENPACGYRATWVELAEEPLR